MAEAIVSYGARACRERDGQLLLYTAEFSKAV